MWVACRDGNLQVARWLFDRGAQRDIWSKTVLGATPTWIAAQNGHLHVLEWLFEVGGATDVQTPNVAFRKSTTPLFEACRGCFDRPKFPVIQCLIENGAVNDRYGHVCSGILRRDLEWYSNSDVSLVRDLTSLVHEQRKFTKIIIQATYGPMKKKFESDDGTQMSPCYLPLLSGHEETLLELVADFLGIRRGRPLRNLREVLQCLVGSERMLGLLS